MPPHLNSVATLPCLRFKSVATHLGRPLAYTTVLQSPAFVGTDIIIVYLHLLVKSHPCSKVLWILF